MIVKLATHAACAHANAFRHDVMNLFSIADDQSRLLHDSSSGCSLADDAVILTRLKQEKMRYAKEIVRAIPHAMIY